MQTLPSAGRPQRARDPGRGSCLRTGRGARCSCRKRLQKITVAAHDCCVTLSKGKARRSDTVHTAVSLARPVGGRSQRAAGVGPVPYPTLYSWHAASPRRPRAGVGGDARVRRVAVPGHAVDGRGRGHRAARLRRVLLQVGRRGGPLRRAAPAAPARARANAGRRASGTCARLEVCGRPVWMAQQAGRAWHASASESGGADGLRARGSLR